MFSIVYQTVYVEKNTAMHMNKIVKKTFHVFHKICVKVNPKIEMARCYYKTFHRWPSFKNPTDLIEKIYWLQLNSDTSLWTKCADKYAVREYVVQCGCSEVLNELYGVWDSVDDFNLDTLPDSFVLKSTNGCGQVMIVRDKKTIDISSLKMILSAWLSTPFGYSGGELHYIKIVPKIIAEKLLVDNRPFSRTLIDYKIWCFNGVPSYIWIAYDRRDIVKVKMALFDTNWEPVPQYLKKSNNDKYCPEDIIPKPESLEPMLDYAAKLSKGFPEVRVDFYEIDGKPVFGELTFSTGFGYFTDEFYRMLGDKVTLK